MAIRQDQVQLRLEFITDESKALAQALNNTKAYNAEIGKANASIKQYEAELRKAGISEAKRAELLRNIEREQQKIITAEKQIVAEGKKVEQLDLSKVAPAQLEQRLRQIKQEMRLIADQSSPAFRALNAELGRINTQFQNIRASSGGPAAGGSGLLGGLGGIAGLAGRAIPIIGGVTAAYEGLKKAISGASELEQLTQSFEVFLGSAEQAKSVIADLKAFEVKTPFEAQQVNEAGRALLAFGFTTDELIPTMTALGDVAAGTGKDFNELALIYGKAKTQGLVQGEELNQLAEAGIPIYKELAKQLNVNESQIRKLGEQGKISFKDLEAVFKNLTGEGSKFGGLMEKQSQTIGGLWSTLKSAFSGLLTQLGTALAPAIKGVLNALISVTDFLRSSLSPAFETLGKVAGGAVSFVRGSIEGMSATVSYVGDGLRKLLDYGKELPVIGGVFKAIGGAIQLVRDSVESLSATFAGIKAAFTDLFTNFGRNMGNAYTEARSAALQEEARARAEAERDERQMDKESVARAKETEAAKQRAMTDERAKAQAAARERAEKAFDAALKGQEAALKREELLLAIDYAKKKLTQEEYEQQLAAVKEAGLRRQLAVYAQFKRDQTNEALDLQRQLIEIENRKQVPETASLAEIGKRAAPGAPKSTADNTATRLAVQDIGEDALQAQLRSKFEAALITEQEYELRRLELKRLALAEEIAILQSATQPQVDEIRKREEAKEKVEAQISEKRVENERRTEEMKRAVQEAGFEATSNIIGAAIELLGQDEAARKRNAGVIKAFESAQVIVQGVAEVQKIWAGSASLGPIAGPIVGGIQTAAAVARTAVALKKISAAKFAGGGYTGDGYGVPDTTGYRPAGIVHEGEYVVPKRIVSEPQFVPVINLLERYRLGLYADGGLVSTTPTAQVSAAVQPPAFQNTDGLIAAMMLFARKVEEMPTEVKSRVVLTELEQGQAELDSVRATAAF